MKENSSEGIQNNYTNIINSLRKWIFHWSLNKEIKIMLPMYLINIKKKTQKNILIRASKSKFSRETIGYFLFRGEC